MVVHDITHMKYSDRSVRVAWSRLEQSRYFRVTVKRNDGSLLWPHIYEVTDEAMKRYGNSIINENGLEGITIPVADLEGMTAYERVSREDRTAP